MKKRIGIFGGTFNPVHNTHLAMPSAFVEQCKLDLCYFVPAFISPFKTEANSSMEIKPFHRVKMLELAIKEYKEFKIETFEIDKQGISYSIDTILYLKSKHPSADFYLLIGEDHANEFDKWKDYEKIFELTEICIIKRPNSLKANNYLEIFSRYNKSYKIIDFPESDISSTNIRDRIKSGLDISKMIPNAVAEYIYTNNLYNTTNTLNPNT
jgi:nicotinate-nucleotide adenylyltransferase